MIDWSQVDELRAEIGAEDFEEVVEIFLEEVEEVITALRGTVSEDRIEEYLHFLKGSALNLGFETFSHLCQNGETAAAQGSFEKIDLAEVVASYEASKTEFLTSLAEHTTA